MISTRAIQKLALRTSRSVSHSACKRDGSLSSLNTTVARKSFLTSSTTSDLRYSLFSTFPSYVDDEVEDSDEYNKYLPAEKSKMNIPGQGWDIDTIVKESLIPGAGSGRFSDVAVPKLMTRVFKKQIVYMSNISTLPSIPRDICIVFENANDLQRFIDLYKNEAGRDHKDIVEYLAHYVISLSSMPGCCAIASSSFVANHGDPDISENVLITREGDDLVAHSVMPIEEGDEILNDYRTFDYFPQFFLDFCKDEGVVDVVTNLKEVLNQQS